MKKTTSYLLVFFMATFLLSSFKINAQQTSDSTEFDQLVQYLEANGNFINSEMAPAIVLG